MENNSRKFRRVFHREDIVGKHYKITSAGNKTFCILKHTDNLAEENGKDRETERERTRKIT